MTGLSRATIDRYESRSQFPARRQLGPGSVRWDEGEVCDWINARPRPVELINVGAAFGPATCDDLDTPSKAFERRKPSGST
jgi:hypothetical protein